MQELILSMLLIGYSCDPVKAVVKGSYVKIRHKANRAKNSNIYQPPFSIYFLLCRFVLLLQFICRMK